MITGELYPRYAEERLVEALAEAPVVLVHGPRQCGKTTLARMAGDPLGYAYFTCDDPVVRGAARGDPFGFVADLPDRSILDEVQHAPEVFGALKLLVDRDRRAGRFVLTGSTNLLLVPSLADSLAGRMEIPRLHPLAQGELARRPPQFLDVLFAARFAMWRRDRVGDELLDRVVAGGYPAALARPAPRRRAAWYRDYVESIVQRDVRDLSRIRSLDILPRLLAAAAGHTAQLVNLADLAGPFQVSRPTVRDYVTLLERVFLLEELPPWHTNSHRRLVKTPKLHLCDTGVASTVLGVSASALKQDRALFGRLLETFVFQELRRQASGHPDEIRFFHFRDRDGFEVDIVLEHGGRIAGVEVKAGATVTHSDFRGLRKLRQVTGERFASGVVIYDGETCVGFGEAMFAVPVRALWEAIG